ncbi:MAG: hypothetical protein OEY57_15590, partial [Nitrospirota bacterium]|nr:hypothetical protein [Nitrospirota bacterium]
PAHACLSKTSVPDDCLCRSLTNRVVGRETRFSFSTIRAAGRTHGSKGEAEACCDIDPIF